MADIAKSLAKINDIEVSSDAPISEALLARIGGGINRAQGEFAKQEAVFTASGPWVCPVGVTQVEAWGTGGGGGGGAGSYTAANGSGQGGMAAPLNRYYINVTPGQTYNVVIGAGGGGGGGAGTGAGNPGNDGGATTFNGYSFAGGTGGANSIGSARANGSERGMGPVFRSFGRGGNGGIYISSGGNTDGQAGQSGGLVLYYAT